MAVLLFIGACAPSATEMPTGKIYNQKKKYIYIYKDLLHRNQWKVRIGLQIVPITNLPLLSL
jgi:hypothetical protein